MKYWRQIMGETNLTLTGALMDPMGALTKVSQYNLHGGYTLTEVILTTNSVALAVISVVHYSAGNTINSIISASGCGMIFS